MSKANKIISEINSQPEIKGLPEKPNVRTWSSIFVYLLIFAVCGLTSSLITIVYTWTTPKAAKACEDYNTRLQKEADEWKYQAQPELLKVRQLLEASKQATDSTAISVNKLESSVNKLKSKVK